MKYTYVEREYVEGNVLELVRRSVLLKRRKRERERERKRDS